MATMGAAGAAGGSGSGGAGGAHAPEAVAVGELFEVLVHQVRGVRECLRERTSKHVVHLPRRRILPPWLVHSKRRLARYRSVGLVK